MQSRVLVQDISTVVLEMRDSVRGIDTRFTYFQAPVRVEDALGRVFPFPSACSVEALVAEIVVRFQQGPGKERETLRSLMPKIPFSCSLPPVAMYFYQECLSTWPS